ncbi:hypothetical protein PC116_g18991 [Phytophthora cactorum]|uniref:Plastocyanin-like domain-containing protein n=2 Tax=Phytophthora cactorum TaxID=29920 RepID=A0A8T1DFI1_9STRA|nr:hypothetical protein PC113_g7882 [Phytophthora cactorum]KAG2916332.1 hypothetical protein PC114_g7545 [Phytophthora cactorum]KAG2938551.1 hypothetical protein PC117_g11170 [Phytophthora cactorum]KAG3167245.1 hypothetical protein C6341_g11765 [Phytophthora cactorum]KAG3194668.1 hypothetical protein PC128_g9158 [Phytophthora cactorum]
MGAVFAWHSDFVTNNWRVTAISADLDGVSVQTVGINDNFVDQAIIDVELGQEVDEGPTIWDSIVINNRGRYNYTVTASHGFTDCTDHQPLPKIHFEADSKYLLRLINMATLAPIVFSADDRKIQVVVADSKYFQPTELINSITINADQRNFVEWFVVGIQPAHFTGTVAGGMKTEELPISVNTRKVEYGKRIEVVLVNGMNEQHPFRLHSHSR